MDIDVRTLTRNGIEITPRGRLDETTVGSLRRTLLDSPPHRPRVLLNLSEVEAVDPAGMALVMMARIELEASGIRFVVESSQPSVTRTLVEAGLSRFVEIAPRRLDALRALGEAPGSVGDRLARDERRLHALRNRFARKADLLPKERRLPVSDVAIR